MGIHHVINITKVNRRAFLLNNGTMNFLKNLSQWLLERQPRDVFDSHALMQLKLKIICSPPKSCLTHRGLSQALPDVIASDSGLSLIFLNFKQFKDTSKLSSQYLITLKQMTV